MIPMEPANTARSPFPAPLDVLGASVTPFESYDQAVVCIADAIDAGRKTFCVAINPQKIHRMWHDAGLRDVVDRADIGIVDGIGVSVAAKILQGIALPRCTGCDLFFRLLPLARRKSWGVFLLGASPESNSGAAAALAERFRGLRIVGLQDGFFSDSDEVVRKINDSGAEMLFVAMGTPRQEMWIASHMDELNTRLMMGVGGSLDVASGTNRRAPKLFCRTGTEFLYQLISQPWRWKRQLAYFSFMMQIFAQRLSMDDGLWTRRAESSAPVE